VVQIDKIVADDAQTYDHFGISVSISGDNIVVGAYYEDTGGNDAGAAYVFKYNSDSNVTQIAKLQAEDAEAYDDFGSSVSISGDYIIIGARNEDMGDSNAGAAYLFKRNLDSDVVQVAKIVAFDAQTNDMFGRTVSISGDYIVVGASGEDTEGSDAGTAYIFDIEAIDKTYIYNNPYRTITFTEVDHVLPVYSFDAASPSGGPISFATGGEDGGAFIFVENNLIFDPNPDYEVPTDDDAHNDYNITISATDSHGHTNTLAIDVLVEDTYYVEKRKIQADDAQDSDYFGKSVSISGDYIVVGAYGEGMEESDSGAAYLYKKQDDGTVIQIAKIKASDAEAGDRFGVSVNISGDYIVVGANGEDT
jgi:hypothetical protein